MSDPDPDDSPTVIHESEVDTRVGGLPPPDGASWLPGDAVGRYVLREELGRGGMGQVFRAFDPDLGRDVALKLIRVEYGQEQAVVGRFLREAHLTARLQHPGIVPVYELGRSVHGSLYYSMRLVRGHTLREVVERLAPADPATWSPFRVLQAVVQVCRAVAFAHRAGVLHRDLKPSNVMIGDYGEVYVLDWGLAKALDAVEPPLPTVQRVDDSGTQVGTVLGTPAFMAPEQGLGDPLGYPADVYSLGGILYFVLTGQPPRRGSHSEVLRSVVKGASPQRPSELREGVPPALEELTLRALESDPSRRLRSARELAEGVQAFLEGRTPSSADRDDAEFLRTYTAEAYRRPSVAVDVALTRPGPDGDEVWLQQRTAPPSSGQWALPGGFVRLEETLEQAAQRVLEVEVGVSQAESFEQLGVFDAPDRDPRTRVISVALRARAPRACEVAESSGAWFAIKDVVGPLAFDHEAILATLRG
ncbi:MAG: protein kinase [Planctomycetota bacterium]